MPTSSKPRKKYRPRARLADPIGYVIEGMTPITKQDSYLLDLKIRNGLSLRALLRGEATKSDMDNMIAMSNIVEALVQGGFGKEYEEVAIAGRFAILSIIYRSVERLKFVPTGPEIKSLQELQELHDAQMETITVRDMEAALARAKWQIANDKDVVKLPKMPEVLAQHLKEAA